MITIQIPEWLPFGYCRPRRGLRVPENSSSLDRRDLLVIEAAVGPLAPDDRTHGPTRCLATRADAREQKAHLDRAAHPALKHDAIQGAPRKLRDRPISQGAASQE